MRFLTANYLYPLYSHPLKEGVLQISEKGEVISIIEDRKLVSQNKLEIFEGILCPGFINAHCHLELSYLQGLIEEKKGMLKFIEAMQKRHSFCREDKDVKNAINIAEKQMIKNGIVAVGDICNTADTLFQKAKFNLKYYNFIEIFDVKNEMANQIICKGKKLRDQFRNFGMKATIVPHSGYSVPPKLMQKIENVFDAKDDLLTIHMQETSTENDLFEKKKGSFFTWLKNINASSEIWNKRSKSRDVLSELQYKKILLVHNTFLKHKVSDSNYYCTCPKANIYIENSLPNYNFFNPDKLCVGTDSLASNNSLSILEELKVIKENSSFDLNTLLKIGSKNGAEALGFSNLGTFEVGKNPGVNLITGLNKVKVIA